MEIDTYFRKIAVSFEIVHKMIRIQAIFNDYTKDFSKIYKSCQETFNERIRKELIKAVDLTKKIIENSQTYLTHFLEGKSTISNLKDDLNCIHSNLLIFCQIFPSNELSPDINLIEQLVDKKLIAIMDIAGQASKDYEKKAKCLLEMKFLETCFDNLKDFIKKQIDALLLREKKTNPDSIIKISLYLNKDERGLGATIIAQHDVFKGVAMALFREKTGKQDITYVLDKIKGDEINKILLKIMFDDYTAKFQSQIKKYLTHDPDLKPLVVEIKTLAGNPDHSNGIMWDVNIKSKIPALLANIFALWTLVNSSHYFEVSEETNKDNYLFQPHPA